MTYLPSFAIGHFTPNSLSLRSAQVPGEELRVLREEVDPQGFIIGKKE